MRQRHGPAELGGRGLLVTLLASLQALEYRLGEFGLAGVVGDPRGDPGGQRRVIGPDRPDEPLPEDLVPRTPSSGGRGAGGPPPPPAPAPPPPPPCQRTSSRGPPAAPDGELITRLTRAASISCPTSAGLTSMPICYSRLSPGLHAP